MPAKHVRLEVLDGVPSRDVIELPLRGHFVLGRESTCDVVLPATGVSRHHALVFVEGERATLHDLGSRNGTYLNGEELAEEGAALKEGDTLRLGPSVLLRVSISQAPIDA